jgi:hypothetical protein
LEDDAGSGTAGYPDVDAAGDDDVDIAAEEMMTEDDESGFCFELLGAAGGGT